MNEMGRNQLIDPLRVLFATIILHLDFQNRERKSVDLALVDVRERIDHVTVINVMPMPILRMSARPIGVDCILADESQRSVNGNSDFVIQGFLEGSSSVVRSEHWLKILL